jgi:hypothetical protein
LFQLQQHDKTFKHEENLERSRQSSSGLQQFVASSFEQAKKEASEPFIEDLTDFLIGANIPFYKVSNQSFIYFMEKYTNRKVPTQSTLRKNYLDVSFQQVFLYLNNNILKKILVHSKNQAGSG